MITPRLISLLSRTAIVRNRIDAEQRRAKPRTVELIRLKALLLRLQAHLRDFLAVDAGLIAVRSRADYGRS